MKPYTVDREINGHKYTAQFNGFSQIYRMSDACYDPELKTTSTEKTTKYLFENVIVQPSGLTADDFDDFDELQEVIKFANEVMKGSFRKKDESGNKGTGKE